MKTPLRYQITEYDCGTVSLLNAISFLYEREEIPSELIRAVYAYTLNCHNTKGIMNDEKAVDDLSRWITNYSKEKKFDLNCLHLCDEDVSYENIEKCIRKGGVVFTKCNREEAHYVIITNINELNTYIFDPYYVSLDEYDSDEIRIIQSKPMDYNRIIRTDRFFSIGNKKFTLGNTNKRECVLMSRDK